MAIIILIVNIEQLGTNTLLIAEGVFDRGSGTPSNEKLTIINICIELIMVKVRPIW